MATSSPKHSKLTFPQVFFLKAFYQSGVLKLDGQELVDHVWVTKEEMRDYVSDDFYRAVQPVLLE